MKKQWFVGMVSALWALGAGHAVNAQERTEPGATSGFYGGVSLRAGNAESAGLNIGPAAASWARFAAPAADDTSTRSLLFGGYRWSNDVAVEALLNTSDKYSLRATDTAPRRNGGVGLSMAPAASGLTDVHARTWNVDLYTSWAFYKTLALYGRFGMAQADSTPLFTGATLTPGTDPRRIRDGVNYGVGLRYDMNSSLGLRVEYARFGRFSADANANGPLPDSDQLTFGVQYRF